MDGWIVVVEGIKGISVMGMELMISKKFQRLLMIYFLCIIGERLPTRTIFRRAVRTCTHTR
jgi:hypothetical protein